MNDTQIREQLVLIVDALSDLSFRMLESEQWDEASLVVEAVAQRLEELLDEDG